MLNAVAMSPIAVYVTGFLPVLDDPPTLEAFHPRVTHAGLWRGGAQIQLQTASTQSTSNEMAGRADQGAGAEIAPGRGTTHHPTGMPIVRSVINCATGMEPGERPSVSRESGGAPLQPQRPCGCNTDAVAAFRTQVTRHWFKALRRRSQRTRLDWTRMRRRNPVATPCPHTASIPRSSLRRSHPRQEPSAAVPHAGSCAAAARQGGPYRDPNTSSEGSSMNTSASEHEYRLLVPRRGGTAHTADCDRRP